LAILLTYLAAAGGVFVLLQTQPFHRLMSKLGDSRGLGGDRRLAVCGTHRSGTTLLGALLSADPRSCQIFEPFNPVFGIEEATRSFIAADWPINQWQEVIDRFLAGEGVRFRRPASNDNRLARWIKGTRLTREYAAARLFRPSRLVIKCPFISLSSQYLIDQHGMQVVFAVKHPASFFVSLRRVGWDETLPLDDLVAQGVIDAATCDAATTPAARAGLLWNVINAHALDTHRRYPAAAAIWSHERFCRDPDAEMSRLTGALHIDYSPAMKLAVSRATHGVVVRPPAATIHELVRNAAEMSDDWRNYVSAEDDAELRARCGTLYRELIGDDW
jgi:hypothetical protein